MSASGEAYDNKGIDQTILKLEIIAGKGKTSLTSNCEFIFVLDKSGSMGSYVEQILNNVFPRVYDKLGFSESKIIPIIRMILKIQILMEMEVQKCLLFLENFQIY